MKTEIKHNQRFGLNKSTSALFLFVKRLVFSIMCLLLFVGAYGISSDSTAEERPERTPSSFSPEWIQVPAGTFKQGQVFENGFRLGYPVRDVTISRDFYLGKTEVTNQQYVTMLNYALTEGLLAGDYKNNVHVKNAIGDQQVLMVFDKVFHGTGNNIQFDGERFVVLNSKENHPVVFVTWFGAAFFANMLGRAEGLGELYDLNDWTNTRGQGYRLPTEAEWEYAARYPDGRTFPWGNDASSLYEKTNFGLSAGSLTPVGLYEDGRSYLGFYDLIGNAEEWVNDWYSQYMPEPHTDPSGPDDGVYKQKRGGSWFQHDNNMPFSAYRYNTNYRYTYYHDVGFRLAKIPD